MKDELELLVDKGDALVPMANSVAITSLTSAEDKLQLPSAITDDIEGWDFFVTVAAVYVAMRALAKSVPDETFRAVGAGVFKKLDKWNPDGSRGFDDCQKFVERSLRSSGATRNDVMIEDAIGMWLLWNLYGRAPTVEESAPARPLGGFLLHTFQNWWVEVS
jgi:hypothetical protein